MPIMLIACRVTTLTVLILITKPNVVERYNRTACPESRQLNQSINPFILRVDNTTHQQHNKIETFKNEVNKCFCRDSTIKCFSLSR